MKLSRRVYNHKAQLPKAPKESCIFFVFVQNSCALFLFSPFLLQSCYKQPKWEKFTIGIKHGFSFINIRQVPWEVLKIEAECRGFQHLPRDLANVNALKNHVRSLLLHKTENICYISRYFLHYFVSSFHRFLANVISTDYARSRAGQYTSRNSSKSVAPVRSYWK